LRSRSHAASTVSSGVSEAGRRWGVIMPAYY
jgi:hypothetical protein